MTQQTTFDYIMPILLEDHDPEINLRPGTTKSDIVAYLYQNPEWGYSPQDIKEALEIPRGTATTTLKRLYDDDYIGKTDDGYYYARDDRDDIRRYVANLTQAHRMFGHHRDADAQPEAPDAQIGDSRTEEELNAELAALEEDVDE
jgi:DNA-binding MarR family transcriptional regulator